MSIKFVKSLYLESFKFVRLYVYYKKNASKN